MKKRIKLYIYITAIMGTMVGYAQKIDANSACYYLIEFPTQHADCIRSVDAHNLRMEEAAKLKAIEDAVKLLSVATIQLTIQTQIQSIDLSALQAQIQASVAKAQAAQYALDQARQAKIQAEQALARAQQELDMAREIAATGQSPQFSPTQMAQTAAAEYTAQTIYYAQLAAQQYAYATQTTTSGSSTIPTWYMDNDGDGWHSASQQKSTPPGAFGWKSTTYGLDCNDNDPTKTYNCSTTAQLPMIPWFLDKDGDGYHAAAQGATSSPGPGWTNVMTRGLDCDDNNKKVHEATKSLGSFSIFQDTRQPGLPDPKDGGVIARDYEEGDLDEARFISLIENNINLGSGPHAKQAMKRYIKRIKILMDSSDDILFENMKNAAWYSLRFQQSPLGNGLGNYTFEENYQANLNMITRFRQDSKGIVDVSGITKSIISQDPNLQAFFNDLKAKVQNKIQSIDKVENINTIKLTDVTSPIFNTGANRFNWNSSWTVNVKFNNVTLNCAQLFGTLEIDVYDQFGLDNKDMFTSPASAHARSLDGIWAWFILQRVNRNRTGVKTYAPFINHYNESQTISIIIN